MTDDTLALAAPPSTRAWSEQQRAIFDWFAHGTGHAIVRARAGTGKTTTILEAINYAPERSILLCAFNKKIAVELTARLQNKYAEARTLHALGYACIKRYWMGLRVDEHKRRGTFLTDQVAGPTAPDPIKRLITKLHTLGREIEPLAREAGSLKDLADEHDCWPDAQWEADGFGVDFVEDHALKAMVLAADEKPIATGVDFADMVYLPVRNQWLRPHYDLVVVDEAQDMTMAQLLIARGVCGGRLCLVGDDRQAIYGFRGAQVDSLDQLKAELGGTELGLNATYRCGQVIVSRAQALVPDFVAGPQNPPGMIRAMPAGIPAMLGDVQPGDFVLSRRNAPLVTVAMGLIRAQKRVLIAGRDIGAGLIALANKLGEGRAANSVPAFLEKLSNWEAREVLRAERAGRPDRIDKLRDQAETMRVLAEDVESVEKIKARITALFTDDGLGAASVVTCSSVHRAKGLEADTVYLLQESFYPPCPCSDCGHFHDQGPKFDRDPEHPTACYKCDCLEYVPPSGRLREEENIEYVAITRAKETLVLVGSSRRPA